MSSVRPIPAGLRVAHIADVLAEVVTRVAQFAAGPSRAPIPGISNRFCFDAHDSSAGVHRYVREGSLDGAVRVERVAVEVAVHIRPGSNVDRLTSCSELGTASPRKTMAFSRLPTAVVAPTAKTRVIMTIDEKEGARRKLRKAWRMSRRSASHMREV